MSLKKITLKFYELLVENKIVIKNFSYLSVIQLFSLITPLIIYPYLVSIFGLELYGKIIYSQVIVTYFSLVINFGFLISGPRDVANLIKVPDKLSKYFSSVLIIKSLIWIICTIIYFGMIFYFDNFREDYLLYLYAYLFTIGDVIFPIWFFQGIEKMKYITIINLLVKILSLFVIFILIHDKSDYIYIPLIYSFAAVISGVFGMYIAMKIEGIKITVVPKDQLIQELKNNFYLFTSSVSIKLYIGLNKLIVGSFLGMKEIAIFDLAEKVVSLLKTPLIVFSQAIFPKISRLKSLKFINGAMIITSSITIIIYGILFLNVDWIVMYFLGDENGIASDIIKILGVSIIFMSFSMFLGGLRIIPFGYNKEYMKVMTSNFILYASLVYLLIFFGFLTLYNIAYVYLLVEFYCILYLFHYSKKLKLLK